MRHCESSSSPCWLVRCAHYALRSDALCLPDLRLRASGAGKAVARDHGQGNHRPKTSQAQRHVVGRQVRSMGVLHRRRGPCLQKRHDGATPARARIPMPARCPDPHQRAQERYGHLLTSHPADGPIAPAWGDGLPIDNLRVVFSGSGRASPRPPSIRTDDSTSAMALLEAAQRANNHIAGLIPAGGTTGSSSPF